MAREVSFGVAERGLENSGRVGGVFLLCMIISSLSMISMMIFVCGHRKDANGKRKSKNSTGFIFNSDGYQGGQDSGKHGGHGHGGDGGDGGHGGDGGDGGHGGCGGGCGGGGGGF